MDIDQAADVARKVKSKIHVEYDEVADALVVLADFVSGLDPSIGARAHDYKGVIDAYHRRLPMMPRCTRITEPRRRAIVNRWVETMAERKKRGEKPIDLVEWWDKVFEYASKSDFLTGRAKPHWVANIDFLTRASSFTKLSEGFYHRDIRRRQDDFEGTLE